MSTHLATTAATVSVEGTVLRCTCSAAQRAAPDWHGARGQPCQRARVESLGRIAYWHRNPLRRLAWRLSNLLRRRPPGAVAIRS